jgi:biotin operon repressor
MGGLVKKDKELRGEHSGFEWIMLYLLYQPYPINQLAESLGVSRKLVRAGVLKLKGKGKSSSYA